MSAERPARGLGMGLEALLGEAARPPAIAESTERAPNSVLEIDVSRIRRNPDQPRIAFDDASLEELAESIRQRGVLQPILVRPDGDGFMIIAGERRWRAAQRAQLHAIPALVREVDDAGTAEIALIENIQRQDLNALEEAEGYRQLIERYGHTQDGVARIVHKSRSHISNLLRLLELPEPVRQALLKGDISMGHARAVASAQDPEELTREIIAKGFSVRQAEERARRQKTGRITSPERPASPQGDADLNALERQLADMLGLKVEIANKGQGGTVTLHYSSLDQLDMVCQRLSGERI